MNNFQKQIILFFFLDTLNFYQALLIIKLSFLPYCLPIAVVQKFIDCEASSTGSWLSDVKERRTTGKLFHSAMFEKLAAKLQS